MDQPNDPGVPVAPVLEPEARSSTAVAREPVIPDAVAEALDGATGDYTVSGDAMRWCPDLAEEPARAPGAGLAGLDVAAGIGSVLGLDAAGVRRLVSGALFSLTAAASDVVTELRQLTRGPAAEEDRPGR